MRFTFPMAFLMLAASAGLAHADLMSGEEIRDAVTGKRIYLATPLGGEFPLYYQRSGTVDGSGEALGIGRWVRPTDSGRWWVDGDSLCQQWETWYDGKRNCFKLQRVGENKLRWTRDDGYSGSARIGD